MYADAGAIAVTASTVLSSPVALPATCFALLCGLSVDYLDRVANNQLYGGGPFEAAYRLENRMNLMQKLDDGAAKVAIFSSARIRRVFGHWSG